MKMQHPGLGIGALSAALAAFVLAIVGGVLSAADSGTSFGSKFVLAETVWVIAAAVAVGALGLGLGSLISRRGTLLGVAACAVVLLAAPVAIVVMDAIPLA
jgi:hypothetical protein